MDPRALLLFVVLILLSMFFSGSETAFTSIPMHKVTAFIKDKKKWAKSLYKLKHQSEKMLITILIGNNIVNISAASLATLLSVQFAKSIWFSQWMVVTISTIVVTILILLFWEIFPKTFANQHSERISLFVAPIYIKLIKIFYPVIFLIEKLMKLFNKKWEKTLKISESDFDAFVELSRKSWALDKWEDIKIKKLLDLDELTAEEVMTPRVKIKALKDNISLNSAIQEATDSPYSRIPIYNKTIDDIDRIVTFKDLIKYKNEFSGNEKLKNIDLEKIIKIPSTQPVNSILEKFQKTHKHLWLVIDEFGGVEWIITLEDIIEEVFGEIQDENDEELLSIRKENWSDAIICQSYVRVDEMLNAMELDFNNFELDEELESTTLWYFITSYLERFPQQWEEIRLPIHISTEIDDSIQKELVIKILSAQKNIIWEVRVFVEQWDIEQ